MPRNEATLLDIAHAARLVQTFAQKMTKEAFLGDFKTMSAILSHLTVIGDAVRRCSPPFRDRHPILLWSLMAGTRDHLIFFRSKRARHPRPFRAKELA